MASTTSQPTSGPQSSPTTSPSLRGSDRPDSRLPPSHSKPWLIAESITHSNPCDHRGRVSPRKRERGRMALPLLPFRANATRLQPIKTYVYGRTLARLFWSEGHFVENAPSHIFDPRLAPHFALILYVLEDRIRFSDPSSVFTYNVIAAAVISNTPEPLRRPATSSRRSRCPFSPVPCEP